MQNQKAVTAYFTSKQLLSFGFAEWRTPPVSPNLVIVSPPRDFNTPAERRYRLWARKFSPGRQLLTWLGYLSRRSAARTNGGCCDQRTLVKASLNQTSTLFMSPFLSRLNLHDAHLWIFHLVWEQSSVTRPSIKYRLSPRVGTHTSTWWSTSTAALQSTASTKAGVRRQMATWMCLIFLSMYECDFRWEKDRLFLALLLFTLSTVYQSPSSTLMQSHNAVAAYL